MFCKLTKFLAIAGLTVLLLAVMDDLMRHVLRHIFFDEVMNSTFVFIRVATGLILAMTIFSFGREEAIVALIDIVALLMIWHQDVLADGATLTHGVRDYTYSGIILAICALYVVVLSWRNSLRYLKRPWGW